MKARKLSAILLAGALMATPVITSTAMAESSQTDSTDSTQSIVDESGNLVIEGTTLTGVTEKGKTAKDIVIPEGVTDIGFDAFSELTVVETITIPKSVTNIETSMMGSYPSVAYTLKSINVSEGNPTYFSEDGVLFSRNSISEKLLCIYPAGKTDKEYNVPENTELCSYVFSGNENLLKINLPESTYLNGYNIFAEDKILTCMGRDYTADEIYHVLAEEGTDFEKREYDDNGLCIVDNKIIDCINCQKDVVIPDGVTKIGDNAFKNCLGVEEIKIPESVTEIGEYAFSGSNIKKIEISKGVTKIAGYAFSQCTNLSEAVLPDTLTEIENGAFYECTSLTEIALPNSLTKIDGNVFRGTGLKSITIPDSVTEIGEFAFSDCQNLTKIEIPKNITKLAQTFYNSTNLTDVKLPEGLKEIGRGTFNKCTSLENIEIPAGVTKLGAWAFSDTKIKSLKIPGGVTVIGENICRSTSTLTDVYFDETKDKWENITVVDKNDKELERTATELFANATLHFKSADPEEKPVVEYTADEETGITASTEEGVIEEGAVLTVTPVEEKTDNENTYGFDISFKNGEKEVQPNGKVTITIPVPEPFKKLAKIYVYHVLNGKYYDMKASIDENGNIVFETDHFSEYVVTSVEVEGALENENSDSSDNDNSSDNSDNESSDNSSDSENSNSGSDKSPNTGFGGIAMTLGVFALAGAAIVVTKKYQR